MGLEAAVGVVTEQSVSGMGERETDSRKESRRSVRKAMKLGRAGHPSKTNGGEWRFTGISLLLPVYEEIEDVTEILWTDRGAMAVSKIKKLTKTKRSLPVFDDREAAG